MFGKVYDVTYRPDSSIEESNIYYYMADVKIDQNTPEGLSLIHISEPTRP